MSEKTMIYQDGTYLNLNENWHLEDSPWKVSQIEKIIHQNNIQFESAVEVGCGAGSIVYELSQKFSGCKFSGFDISPQAAEFWSKFDRVNNLNFKLLDFLQTDDFYDLLLLIDVFEHVPNYLEFLKSISKRSKFFIFNIPLDMHIVGLFFDHQVKARENYGHLHYFSKMTALKTLEDCEYEVLDYFFAPGFSGSSPESTRKLFRHKLLFPLRKILFTISPELNAKFLGGASLMVLARSTHFN